ncbi:hypothetical protein PENTCL1PPCAC_12502, partial [Pristionchus entomophagus]
PSAVLPSLLSPLRTRHALIHNRQGSTPLLAVDAAPPTPPPPYPGPPQAHPSPSAPPYPGGGGASAAPAHDVRQSPLQALWWLRRNGVRHVLSHHHRRSLLHTLLSVRTVRTVLPREVS